MASERALAIPKSLLPSSQIRIPSTSEGSKYNLTYYLKGALAGGLCCGLTHGTFVEMRRTFVSLGMRVLQLSFCTNSFLWHEWFP